MSTEVLSLIARARASTASPYSHRHLEALTQLLRQIPCLELDWDEYTGEEWMRLLSGEEVIALVLAAAPFAIVVQTPLGQRVAEFLHHEGNELLLVSAMASKELTADLRLLEAAFPGVSWPTEAIDSECLSADDLWWATVV